MSELFDARNPATSDMPDEVKRAMSEPLEAQQPQADEPLLPKFDMSNPPRRTADMPLLDIKPRQSQRADETPPEVIEAMDPETGEEGNAGPSPQDMVQFEAWNRRNQRRKRMGQGSLPWEGNQDMMGRDEGGGGMGQDTGQWEQKVDRIVELLESIEQKLDDIGGLG